ncbi:hypothetical protein Nocox_36005 [Nonomuraea coxensis DSM 45129]|uniref:Adhesin domain-containing protein n=1 Tax=Nonomuraea coxensis DSM 45129 TaxID=1122611 RepID=A0ABX8UB51_9ACTN|nr:hypothetical protein [Nonomuraea coxensis]QYC44760.1 hypothetical protein Nocox_36005 [Nonomuraea coxensis DSM 45129]
MRALWLTAGAMATVLALLWSTAALWTTFARAREPVVTDLRSIPFDGDTVEIKATATPISLYVVPGRAGELLISRSMSWSKERPKVAEDWDPAAATLRLGTDCPGSDQPDGPLCRADYTVFVPPETDVVAGTTAGELVVDNLFGSLRLTSVSGPVRLDEVAGPVWARTGSGDIDADRLGGESADLETGAGEVRVAFTGRPASVRAVVRTRGDVSVVVPPAAYAVTASGTNVTLDIGRDMTAPRKIEVSTVAGAVSVCCR